MFLFRRERVKYLEIGDVQGAGGWHMVCVVELGVEK
jgi:hypothetical protein